VRACRFGWRAGRWIAGLLALLPVGLDLMPPHWLASYSCGGSRREPVCVCVFFQPAASGSIGTQRNPRHTGDPWNGRLCEWSLNRQCRFYNVAVIPKMPPAMAFWDRETSGDLNPNRPDYQDIRTLE